MEYRITIKKWCTEHVKLWEHPTRNFEGHKASKKHKEALQKQLNVKRMLVKGNIYQKAQRDCYHKK